MIIIALGGLAGEHIRPVGLVFDLELFYQLVSACPVVRSY